MDAYYKDYLRDFPMLARAAWGYTVETATTAIRLVLSGVFDAYPRLKIVLGHLGETLPFLVWRVDHALARPGAKTTSFRDIFCSHFYITTSGNFSNPALLCCVMEMGIDRVLFAVDWPFVANKPAVQWMDTVPLCDEDKIKILSGNATGCSACSSHGAQRNARAGRRLARHPDFAIAPARAGSIRATHCSERLADRVVGRLGLSARPAAAHMAGNSIAAMGNVWRRGCAGSALDARSRAALGAAARARGRAFRAVCRARFARRLMAAAVCGRRGVLDLALVGFSGRSRSDGIGRGRRFDTSGRGRPRRQRQSARVRDWRRARPGSSPAAD